MGSVLRKNKEDKLHTRHSIQSLYLFLDDLQVIVIGLIGCLAIGKKISISSLLILEIYFNYLPYT